MQGGKTQAIGKRSGQVTLIQDAKGAGTGLAVGGDGWILTNKHVAPSVGPYRVITASGKDVRGVGIHQSPHHDLAVVKVATETPSFLDLESETSEDFQVGDEVFAVGHPRGCRFSVTRGIISNPHRELDGDHYVQTDVSINPGSSGGPLLDAAGQLVGVVTLMLSHSQGLGFAVPGYTAADYVRNVRRLVRQGVIRVPDELLDGGRVQRDETMVVRDAVNVLCEAGKASIANEDSQSGSYSLESRGRTIDVRCSGGRFEAHSVLVRVGAAERGNASMLASLLELNGKGELGGACLSLKAEGICVGVSRGSAGLDQVEAVQALSNVVYLAAQLAERVASLVYAAPAGTVAAADPGYPLITLPE